MSLFWVASSLLAFVLAAGCGTGQHTPVSYASPRLESPRTIVLFVIDTLRADRLGVYGATAETSPFIDGLASESVLFERAHSPGPWTLPSVVSIHTSLFMAEHGVTVEGARIADEVVPLASRLKEVGWTTASFFLNPYVGPMSGLDRGFDVCEGLQLPVDGEFVGTWLEKTTGEELRFLYLHNVEPHDPWAATEADLRALGSVVPDAVKEEIADGYKRYRKLTRVDSSYNRKVKARGLNWPLREVGDTDNTIEQRKALNRLSGLEGSIRALYDARVRAADGRLGSVIAKLKERGLWEETLFIVASDHGEELNDRGGWQHDHSVYQELVRVPLLVKFPGGAYAGRRISTPVSLVDLLPTILEIVGHSDLANPCRGQSVLPLLIADEAREPRVTAMRENVKKYFRPYKERRGDVNFVVSRGKWKGIFNEEVGSFELYDLDEDPGETVSRAEAHPDRVARMMDVIRRSIDQWRREAKTPVEREIQDSERKVLQKLGYVSESESESR